MAARRRLGRVVVAEDEERPADGHDPAVAAHAHQAGAHGVLADAVVDLAAARVLGRLALGAVQLRPGVAREVGRADDEPGHGLDAGGEHLLQGLAGGQLLARLEPGEPVRPSPAAPSPAQAASQAARSPSHSASRLSQAWRASAPRAAAWAR